MTNILLIIQLIICIVLIGLILIQKSEGGALGMGGGGGGGGLMSGRSSANAVTKATTILGTLFLVNSIALTVFFSLENQDRSRLTENPTEQGLNIEQSPSNTDTPLADEISDAGPDAGTADEVEPQAEDTPESADTDETQSPQ